MVTDLWMTDAEMDSTGDDFSGMLKDSCVITRSPATLAGGLPNPAGWSTVATVPCNVQQPSAGRPLPGIPQGSPADRLVKVKRHTDVQFADHITVGGEELDVLDVVKPTFHFLVKLLCQKIVPYAP